MLFSPRLTRRSRTYQRPLLWLLAVAFVIDALRTIGSRGSTVRLDPASSSTIKKPSVFIVSVHRNTEEILRSAWNENLLKLVDYLGHGNVYVSAVESGSQDHTKEALLDLKESLTARGVDHTIELGTTVWEQLDELNAWPEPGTPMAERPGWIWHAEEEHFALRRIPYLARVRNQAMAPLLQIQRQRQKTFDYVLWINDVAFDTADVMTLLKTRGGHFAAACAMDFKAYPYYYDTFALRDINGDKAVSDQWPWFRSADARTDVKAGRSVRVQSCWNGMIAFDAQPFYDKKKQQGSKQGSKQGMKTADPLLFRGVEDSLAEFHLEGSECCLIHADNPLSRFGDAIPESGSENENVGVWLNPNVRVAYSAPVYEQVRRASLFPGAFSAVRGIWANRWERARSSIQFMLESQTVLNRLRRWRSETPEGAPPRSEPGAVCLINEMQIMWQNGWKHL
ncbi:polysaccharide export protein [Ophiostoma piceae UAMH 11346]|uniref:Polysaccharide export protein n=1 Tax=Ophiostoma piceae (strain UAMH 11346) TaxID=1262450 RepID=S3C630_OPHP1|nr:polysaccharide export protein [Ophiostoma piceae UAMH 11346]